MIDYGFLVFRKSAALQYKGKTLSLILILSNDKPLVL